MLKNYIYLNILFIFGLVVYLFSLNFHLELYDTFYLFFSIFGIVVPLLFIFSEYKYRDLTERKFYQLLFLGFTSFGLANLGWYLFDLLEINSMTNYLNIFFIFQVITKQIFFKYIYSKESVEYKNILWEKIISINIGILLVSIFATQFISLNSIYFDIYFILESILSVVFIIKCRNYEFFSHIDLKYFLTGTTLWLLGDLLFVGEVLFNSYFIGSYSDFIYFVGFYLMLASVVFKNFNLIESLDTKIDFKFTFS